jgi:xanthosine utilization system XapX-like protein
MANCWTDVEGSVEHCSVLEVSSPVLALMGMAHRLVEPEVASISQELVESTRIVCAWSEEMTPELLPIVSVPPEATVYM